MEKSKIQQAVELLEGDESLLRADRVRAALDLLKNNSPGAVGEGLPEVPTEAAGAEASNTREVSEGAYLQLQAELNDLRKEVQALNLALRTYRSPGEEAAHGESITEV